MQGLYQREAIYGHMFVHHKTKILLDDFSHT